MRVLLIEDEVLLAEQVADGLRDQGIAVDLAADGLDGLHKATANRYDVIVLDRDLPLLHGDQVCTALVAGASQVRILMLTAAGEAADRIAGLILGADDYLPKPFAFAELVLRIRALARRANNAPRTLLRAGLSFDTARRVVTRDGRIVALTTKELAVLEILMSRRRRRGQRRGPAGTGVGRARRPVHRDRPGHPGPTAPKAGGSTADRNRRRSGVPAVKPHRSIRLRLTLVYGGVLVATCATLLALNYALLYQSLYTRIGALAPADIAAMADKGRGRQRSDGRQRGGRPGRHREAPVVRSRAGVGRAATRDTLVNTDRHVGHRVWSIAAVVGLGVSWLVAGRLLRRVRTLPPPPVGSPRTACTSGPRSTGPRDELKELADTLDADGGPAGSLLQQPATIHRRRLARTTHARSRSSEAEPRCSWPSEHNAPEQWKPWPQRVLMATGRAERLLDGLLALARSDSGAHRRRAVRPRGRGGRAPWARPTTRWNSAELSDHHRPAPRPGQAATRVLLERLVRNLADNAIRHNHFAVAGSSVTTGDDQPHLRQQVRNSGQLDPGRGDHLRLFAKPFPATGIAPT